MSGVLAAKCTHARARLVSEVMTRDVAAATEEGVVDLIGRHRRQGRS
jgi:hypothetical protein